MASRRASACDAGSVEFAALWLAFFPCVLHPVIMLRLFLHRVLTTLPCLPRWKSCASRSSFASDAPKSPRSRASSTDTDASTLRKRRKVNLTLNCGGWTSDSTEDPPPGPGTAKRGAPSMAHSLLERASVSSACGLALEPLHSAASKESLRSDSSEGKRSSAGNVLSLAAQDSQERAAIQRSKQRSLSVDSDTVIPSPVKHSLPGFVPLPSISVHLHHKPRRSSFRFSSLRHSNKQRSKSHANIKVLHNQETAGKETPEQEILAFQKQLQNLPDFDSPEHPTRGIIQDPIAAAAEFLANRGLRPRSRSMPRVSYESSRFLTLPEVPWPSLGNSIYLPRGRSAGALGGPLDHGELVHSMATTPAEEKKFPAVTVPVAAAGPGPNSRRSSLSPSDRIARRRDSPACIALEIPVWHRSIFTFIEEWLQMSQVEMEHFTLLARELRDFLNKISTCGSSYSQWCAELRQQFPALNRDPDVRNADDLDETDKEYYQVPGAAPKINLGGLMIGNGLTDPENMLYYSDFLYKIGLVDDKTRAKLKEYEDYARKDIKDEEYRDALDWLNFEFNHILGTTGFQYPYDFTNDKIGIDDRVIKFVQKKKVRKAIHVGSYEFNDFYMPYNYLMNDMMQSVRPWVEELLTAEEFPIMFYSGQLDIIVAYPLSVAFYDKLKWPRTSEYREAKRCQFRVGVDVAGYFKTAGTFTEVMVRNTGHMVPLTQPRWAFELMDRFITNSSYFKC